MAYEFDRDGVQVIDNRDGTGGVAYRWGVQHKGAVVALFHRRDDAIDYAKLMIQPYKRVLAVLDGAA